MPAGGSDKASLCFWIRQRHDPMITFLSAFSCPLRG